MLLVANCQPERNFQKVIRRCGGIPWGKNGEWSKNLKYSHDQNAISKRDLVIIGFLLDFRRKAPLIPWDVDFKGGSGPFGTNKSE